MKHKMFLILPIFIITLFAFITPKKNVITFKTSAKHKIKVVEGKIEYDNKVIAKIKYDDVLYESKFNRLIEDHGSSFLFIAMYGAPNLDRLNVFLITPKKATQVADAILSRVKDYDGDGYLEFGGCDLTEAYGNPDSMYYVPTIYYEIRKGEIHPDNSLTRREDTKLNGLYLPPAKQLDKYGNCCSVVAIPGRKHKIRTQK